MSFSITADFPLGVYQGHDKRGFAERFPSMLRLQAAFLSAAYTLESYEDAEFGTEADDYDDAIGLSAELAAAARWYEDNPPSAISLPSVLLNETPRTIAYRNKGLIESHTDKGKTAEPAISYVALNGPIVWWWDEEPESGIFSVMQSLSAEISYLGEVSSPVKISVALENDIPSDAWARTEGLSLDSVGLPTFDSPKSGRAELLQEAYIKSNSLAIPKDSCKSKESEIPDLWLDGLIQKVCYESSEDSDSVHTLPWAIGYLLEMEPDSTVNTIWPPAEENYLKWSVSFHRALTSKCGNDVPVLLSGARRESGVEHLSMPANGVSIQIVDPSLPINKIMGISAAAFLIMFPSDADPDEIGVVENAVESLKRVYCAELGSLSVLRSRIIPLDTFWEKPDEGYARWWQPRPLYVSDNRPPRGKRAGKEDWTLEDTICVSIGYVWRKQFVLAESSGQRMEELSKDVRARGVEIVGVRPLHPLSAKDYLHHMNKGAFFAPATALINLGNLSGESAVVAIGQTRHFGGGLLVPVDIPNSTTMNAESEVTGEAVGNEQHRF